MNLRKDHYWSHTRLVVNVDCLLQTRMDRPQVAGSKLAWPAIRKTVTVGYLACPGCRAQRGGKSVGERKSKVGWFEPRCVPALSPSSSRAVGRFGRGSRWSALSPLLSGSVRPPGSSRFLAGKGGRDKLSAGEGLKSPACPRVRVPPPPLGEFYYPFPTHFFPLRKSLESPFSWLACLCEFSWCGSRW